MFLLGTPLSTQQKWNFYGIFVRSDGWCCGNQTAASG